MIILKFFLLENSEEQKKAISLYKQAEEEKQRSPNKATQFFFEAAKLFCQSGELRDAVNSILGIFTIQNYVLKFDEKSSKKFLLVIQAKLILARLLRFDHSALSEEIYNNIIFSFISFDGFSLLADLIEQNQTFNDLYQQSCLLVNEMDDIFSPHFLEYKPKDLNGQRYEGATGIFSVISPILEEIGAFYSRFEVTGISIISYLLSSIINKQQNFKDDTSIVFRKLSCLFYQISSHCHSFQCLFISLKHHLSSDFENDISFCLALTCEIDDKVSQKRFIDWMIQNSVMEKIEDDETKVHFFFFCFFH